MYIVHRQFLVEVEFGFVLRNSKLFWVPGMQKSMNKHRKAINTATPTVSKMRLSALNNRQWWVGWNLNRLSWAELIGLFVGQPNEMSCLTLYTNQLSRSEIVLHSIIFLFKASVWQHCLRVFGTVNPHSNPYGLLFRMTLIVPCVQTQRYGSRSFRVSGPTVWNSLPQNLRSSDISREQFKRGLKTWLFERAYV